MEIFTKTLLQLVIIITIFLVLTLLGRVIRNKIKNRLDKSEYIDKILPKDELHTLKQVFYLILMALCIVNVFYSFISSEMDLYTYGHYFSIFDIALSLYFAIMIDKSSKNNILLWFLLIPYGSLSYSLFGVNLVFLIVDIIHVLVFIYFAKRSFDKFMEYTNSNGLGVTIILLFTIIFGSFFITQYTENVNALDSLVIVSNQFTGNGYSAFGETISGKLNSLLLVWGGYVISGAGAATLTAALLIRHFKKEFAELKELIEEEAE